MINKISDLCFEHKVSLNQRESIVGVFGDPHVDSKGFQKEEFVRHLEQCAEKRAIVVFIGDLFDAMQGRNDRRGSKSSVVDGLGVDDYFTELVDRVADFLAPYLKKVPHCIALSGNHETAVSRHNEIDLLKMLKYALFSRGVKNFDFAGYRAYIKHTVIRKKAGKELMEGNLIGFFHHGYSGGQRSKGVLKADIMHGTYSSADYMCTGHVHMQWSLPLYRLRLNKSGEEQKEEVVHIQVPSYKEDIQNKSGGYAVEKGFAPGAIGGYFIHLTYWMSDGIMRKRIREVRM